MFLWPVSEPHLLLFLSDKEWSETTHFPAKSKGHCNMLLIIFHHTDDIVQCLSAAHWTARGFFWVPMMMPRLIMQVSESKHFWVIKDSLRVLGCQSGSTYYAHCHLLGDFSKSGDCILPNTLLLNVNTWLFPININIWLIAGQPLAVHPSFIFPNIKWLNCYIMPLSSEDINWDCRSGWIVTQLSRVSGGSSFTGDIKNQNEQKLWNMEHREQPCIE